MDKKKKILVGLDIFGLILSVVGVFVLTIMFKIDGSIFRYLFLVGDLIIFIIFSSLLNDLESDLQSPVKKYSMTKIDSKYINKLDKVPLPDPHVFVENGVYYIVGTCDINNNIIACYTTTDFNTYNYENLYYWPIVEIGYRYKSTSSKWKSRRVVAT